MAAPIMECIRVYRTADKHGWVFAAATAAGGILGSVRADSFLTVFTDSPDSYVIGGRYLMHLTKWTKK